MVAICNIKGVHPFPARMAPSIVWDRLPESGPPLRICDPMVGSGTTLAVARSKGHEAFGVDMDPLAVMISKAWCCNIEREALYNKANEVLKRAAQTARHLGSDDGFPAGADEETKQFVEYWFDLECRKQLRALSMHIASVRDPVLRLLLWTAFSRMIITKKIGVSLAIDVSHSRPHRAYKKAPVVPFAVFGRAVDRVANGNPFSAEQHELPAANVDYGDARHLSYPDNFFHLVVTSPPYLNAIDYLRGHKLSLVWMRNCIERIRNIRSASIGAEVTYKLPSAVHLTGALGVAGQSENLTYRQRGILSRYIADMDCVCGEISRVLKPKGRVIYVIGDSTIGGTFISNSRIIRYLSEHHGLQFEKRETRPLVENRRYLPPPSNREAGRQMMGRMRREIILTMFKP